MSGPLPRDEAEFQVELLMQNYRGVKVSVEEHDAKIAEVYGKIAGRTPEAVQSEFEAQGVLIAVLFRRLAEARGVGTFTDAE